VQSLRKVAAPARFAAVVKSNAYGHGLARVAEAIAADVDMLCVYRVAEGCTIREAGVQGPVLVLGPVPPSELAAALAANLSISLWDAGSYLADAARTAREAGVPLRVHAKIETGVTRLGMAPERAAISISQLLSDSAFELEGAFTHLAAVEELESGYTLQQLERFESALRPVEAALRLRGALRHAAASAAAMLFPRARFDLVRVGISTYGLWPSPETRNALSEPIALEPALSWRTTLVSVRDVPAGTSVGYGCTFHTERPSRIGVLPIGYAEGIPRVASNRGAVLVEGSRAPIVGRVCMNMTMVDVTDIPLAHAGSVATLIGSNGNETLGAEDWGRWADTIDYEIVARLPAELPRVYREDPQ